MNEQLKKVLDDHQLWLETEGKEGKQANLSGADLRETNLRETDLRGANLSGADLRGADLREADLRGADLRGADLRGADLREADLREADLSGANLRGADLRGADLSGADLRGADLSEANLRGADLSGADLDYSCWPLWCGTLRTKVDVRIASQLAYHFCSLDCDDLEYSKARNAIADFANKFHRAEECGKIEVEEEHEKI